MIVIAKSFQPHIILIVEILSFVTIALFMRREAIFCNLAWIPPAQLYRELANALILFGVLIGHVLELRYFLLKQHCYFINLATLWGKNTGMRLIAFKYLLI